MRPAPEHMSSHHHVHDTTSPPSCPPVSDRALLLRWVAGSRAAGNRLLGRYYGPLCRYFSRVAPTYDSAELTQETLTQLCVSVDLALESKASFCAYLFGIARNIFYQQLRRSYRKRELHGELPNEVVERRTPAATLELVRERAVLTRLLAELPDAQRALLQSFFWENRTAEQLGAELGIPPGTVRTRVFHQKRRLMEALERASSAMGEGDLQVEVQRLRQLMIDGPQPAEASAPRAGDSELR